MKSRKYQMTTMLYGNFTLKFLLIPVVKHNNIFEYKHCSQTFLALSDRYGNLFSFDLLYDFFKGFESSVLLIHKLKISSKVENR